MWGAISNMLSGAGSATYFSRRIGLKEKNKRKEEEEGKRKKGKNWMKMLLIREHFKIEDVTC